MVSNQKIKIKLVSFDHKVLDRAARDIVLAVKRTGADLRGPVPLPRSIEKFTVNRSPHVNKKSREQFEIRTQNRLIIINYPTSETVEELKKIDLAAGVDIEVRLLD